MAARLQLTKHAPAFGGSAEKPAAVQPTNKSSDYGDQRFPAEIKGVEVKEWLKCGEVKLKKPFFKVC